MKTESLLVQTYKSKQNSKMKQIIPKQKQKLTYLLWQDAHSSSGWFTKDQLEKNVNEDEFNVEEIGWIIYEDDKEIHMVARRGTWDKVVDLNTTHEYGMYQRIPKTWILKRKVITI